MVDTKAALLKEAQNRFGSQGFAATSIRGLAASVGIKESSVYNHFPSKEALFDAVLEQADVRLAAVADRFDAPIAVSDDAAKFYENISLDKLQEIADGFLDHWIHDPEFVSARRLLTVEQYRMPEAGRRLRHLLIERPLEFQVPLFRELIRTGHFITADPEATALAFWGPIYAILASTDAPEDEPEARRLLHLHIEHFRTSHALSSSRKVTP